MAGTGSRFMVCLLHLALRRQVLDGESKRVFLLARNGGASPLWPAAGKVTHG